MRSKVHSMRAGRSELHPFDSVSNNTWAALLSASDIHLVVSENHCVFVVFYFPTTMVILDGRYCSEYCSFLPLIPSTDAGESSLPRILLNIYAQKLLIWILTKDEQRPYAFWLSPRWTRGIYNSHARNGIIRSRCGEFHHEPGPHWPWLHWSRKRCIDACLCLQNISSITSTILPIKSQEYRCLFTRIIQKGLAKKKMQVQDVLLSVSHSPIRPKYYRL